MAFTKVSEQKVFLRALLYGSPGAGKTLSSLILAKEISKFTGKGVALLDTEAGRSSHKLRAPQLQGFSWDCDIVESPTAETYVKAIKEAIEGGYSVIVLDSISPEWESVMSAQSAYTKTGVNTFQAWGKAKVPHKEFTSALLSAPIHIIATCRAKTEYVIENGKPQRVGLAPIQEPSITYSFDIVLLLESKGIISFVDKDESGIFQPDMVISEQVANKLVNTWLCLGNGDTPQEPSNVSNQQEDSKLRAKYIERIQQLAAQLDEYVDLQELNSYSLEELQALGKSLRGRVDNLA